MTQSDRTETDALENSDADTGQSAGVEDSAREPDSSRQNVVTFKTSSDRKRTGRGGKGDGRWRTGISLSGPCVLVGAFIVILYKLNPTLMTEPVLRGLAVLAGLGCLVGEMMLLVGIRPSSRRVRRLDFIGLALANIVVVGALAFCLIRSLQVESTHVTPTPSQYEIPASE